MRYRQKIVVCWYQMSLQNQSVQTMNEDKRLSKPAVPLEKSWVLRGH